MLYFGRLLLLRIYNTTWDSEFQVFLFLQFKLWLYGNFLFSYYS